MTLPLTVIFRTAEDYAVVYMGAAVFKITRLLVIAISCVHVFACMFFKVKIESAESPDEVVAFYAARGIKENVIFKLHCFPRD